MERGPSLVRTLKPLLLLWLALHLAALAVLAIGFGLIVSLKAAIGWIAHHLGFVLLVSAFAWLTVRFAKTPGFRPASPVL